MTFDVLGIFYLPELTLLKIKIKKYFPISIYISKDKQIHFLILDAHYLHFLPLIFNKVIAKLMNYLSVYSEIIPQAKQ